MAKRTPITRKIKQAISKVGLEVSDYVNVDGVRIETTKGIIVCTGDFENPKLKTPSD